MDSSDVVVSSSLPPPARRRWVHAAVAAGVLAGGVVLSQFMFSLKPTPVSAARLEMRPAVEVLTVVLADHPVQVVTQGFFAPVTETKAASEVAGRIVAVSPAFVVGGVFKEGDVLLEIDAADYAAAVAQAEGALAEARLLLENELARADQARRDWQRLEPQEKPGPLVLREPHVASARARLAAAEAALDKARRDLGRTQLRAPYPGLVRAKRADLGDYVTPGAPLAELWRSDVFEIRLPVSVVEAEFVDLAAGAVAVLSDGVREWTAPVVRSEGLVDPATRTTALIARLDQATPAPTPGLFVKAKVQGRLLKNVAVIPRRALVGPDRVVVVDEAGGLRFRSLTIVWQESGQVLVSAGLQPGDRVVLTALAAVVEGMPVELIDGGTASPQQSTPRTDDSRDGEKAKSSRDGARAGDSRDGARLRPGGLNEDLDTGALVIR